MIAKNLFPEDMIFNETNLEEFNTTPEEVVKNLKRSYAFDFEKGEFIKDRNGKVLILNEFESYIQWCNKALLTVRSSKLAYSDLYGSEYYTLIGSGLDKKAVELEVERMTRETLKVHPYTDKVENFSFKWEKNKSILHFNFEVVTLLDERRSLKQVWEFRGVR